MKRRTFIKNTLPAVAAVVVVPSFLPIKSLRLAERIPLAVIEKGVKDSTMDYMRDKSTQFKKDIERLQKSPYRDMLKDVQPSVDKHNRRDAFKFRWDASYVNDMEFDSLDVVELIMELEKKFNCAIPDSTVEQAGTPRQLADLLFDGLNNGIVYYEMANFKGKETYLYADKGQNYKVHIHYKNGSDLWVCPLEGSLRMPMGYGLDLVVETPYSDDGQTIPLVAIGGKWDCAELRPALEQKIENLNKILEDKYLYLLLSRPD